MLLINQLQHSYLFDSDDHIIIMNSYNGLPYGLKLDLPWSGQVLVFHELLQFVKLANNYHTLVFLTMLTIR